MTPAILYVHDLRGSGVVTNALALARRLGAERETILCAGYGEGLNRAAEVAPARLIVLDHGPQPRRARLAAAVNLRALIKESGTGLVVSMGNFGHSTVFAATRLMRVRTVYRVSNEIGRPQPGLRNFRRRSWQRLLIATADRIILVGRTLADQPLFAGAIAIGSAVYIPNGVDLDQARRETAKPSPHRWFDDLGPPVVLTVGRIHPQKNLKGLIEGAALAMRKRPLRLIILGSGEAARIQLLKRRAADLEISDAVLFAGETDNVFAWLARSDVFALVSHWEGSSTALLEALAVGTPILASRQAGDAVHVLDDGRFGVLVEAGDPAGIAAGILRQLDDPVRPDDRAAQYRLGETYERYLEVFDRL